METLVIIAVIGTCMLVATVILFALRYSRVYVRGAYSKAAWLAILMWSVLTIASSLLPLDYWHNPPFKRMIKLPAEAKVLSYYKIALGKREAFGNPWTQGKSVFGNAWFERRGFDRIMRQDYGKNIPELDSIASQEVRFYAICAYEDAGISKGIIVEPSGGASSGDNFIILRQLEKNDNEWTEAKCEEHYRSSLDDWFTRFFIASFFGLVFAGIAVVSFLVFRCFRSRQSSYIVPKRYVSSLIPIFSLWVLGVLITTWAIVPCLIEHKLSSLPPQLIIIPLGCSAVAYILYRIVLWREKVFCSNKELKATDKSAP